MAQLNQFFVSCPLGFETDLVEEIESFWFKMMDLDGLPTRSSTPEFLLQSGGIDFEAEVHLGYQINFFSRIALRVLQRVAFFDARFFDQFEKNFAKVDLKKFFSLSEISLNVESTKSRLFHEKNLIESLTRVLSLQKFSVVENSNQALYVRIHKDRAVISLDTTGEHLHFRGYRKEQGEAPLRENLAHLVLRKAGLWKQRSEAYTVVFDPYCGAGTFLFEAALGQFPHFHRDYSFIHFKNVPALFKSEVWTKNYRWIKPSVDEKMNFIGFDYNQQTIEKAIRNKQEFKSLFYDFSVQFKAQDSESFSTSDYNELFKGEQVFVVCNPPYGHRSEANQVIPLLQRLEEIPFVRGVAVLHPEDWKMNFKRLKLVNQTPLSNQGLKTLISVYK